MRIVGNLSTGSLKKLKKIIQTLLPRNNHFLGICHYILTFCPSSSSPQNLCFKSSEHVRERPCSRESYVDLEDQVCQRYSEGGRDSFGGAC